MIGILEALRCAQWLVGPWVQDQPQSPVFAISSHFAVFENPEGLARVVVAHHAGGGQDVVQLVEQFVS